MRKILPAIATFLGFFLITVLFQNCGEGFQASSLSSTIENKNLKITPTISPPPPTATPTVPTTQQPSIVTEPKPITTVAGVAQSLSVLAEGAIQYQWYKDGELIPGATESKYSPGGLNPNVVDSGNYHVVVSNDGGSTGSLSVNFEVVNSDGIWSKTCTPESLSSGTYSSNTLSSVAGKLNTHADINWIIYRENCGTIFFSMRFGSEATFQATDQSMTRGLLLYDYQISKHSTSGSSGLIYISPGSGASAALLNQQNFGGRANWVSGVEQGVPATSIYGGSQFYGTTRVTRSGNQFKLYSTGTLGGDGLTPQTRWLNYDPNSYYIKIF